MEALQAQGLKGRHIDFLYVDEAQDNLIVDAARERPESGNHGSIRLTVVFSVAIVVPQPTRSFLCGRHGSNNIGRECLPLQ